MTIFRAIVAVNLIMHYCAEQVWSTCSTNWPLDIIAWCLYPELLLFSLNKNVHRTVCYRSNSDSNSTTKCVHIQINLCYEFGHTLLHCSCPAGMFNKPASVMCFNLTWMLNILAYGYPFLSHTPDNTCLLHIWV